MLRGLLRPFTRWSRRLVCLPRCDTDTGRGWQWLPVQVILRCVGVSRVTTAAAAHACCVRSAFPDRRKYWLVCLGGFTPHFSYVEGLCWNSAGIRSGVVWRGIYTVGRLCGTIYLSLAQLGPFLWAMCQK